MPRRPKTAIEPELRSLAYKMKDLEKENEKLGKIIDIAFETLEIIWKSTKDKRVKIGLKKMARINK